MPFTLGLTGGIGSGKTAASDHFATLGIDIVDADLIARDLVQAGSPTLEKIRTHFGAKVLKSDGNLNRERLRQIIFENPEKKDWIEGLLHPLIRQRILQQAQQATSPYGIVVAPLMLETGLAEHMDRVLVIDCDEDTQLARATQRDASPLNQRSAATIKHIMQQQIQRPERLARADDIIDNMGSPEQLQHAVERYHQQLMEQLSHD